MPSADLIELFVVPIDQLGLPYMVTGAAAAIIFGEPRLTSDIDIVIAASPGDAQPLHDAFDSPEPYVRPVETIAEETARGYGGHFNVIHAPSGLKADLYPAGDDPLHDWALARRRMLSVHGSEVAFAPPECVILRKLEFLRDEGSEKHLRDVRTMLLHEGARLDIAEIDSRASSLGVAEQWNRARAREDRK